MDLAALIPEVVRSLATTLTVWASTQKCPDCLCSPTLNCPGGEVVVGDRGCPSTALDWSTISFLILLGVCPGQLGQYTIDTLLPRKKLGCQAAKIALSRCKYA